MNTKLKSFLTTIWNEPRAFWGSLFLFSALIFCGIAALAANRTVGNPIAPALQMTALFALLSGLVSLAGFFLAWFPPVRRCFVWLLRRRFLVLVILATLIALAYAVENWRGRRAWTRFQQEAEANGDRFDVTTLSPATIPDDQNFFMAEPWAALRQVATNSPIMGNNNNPPLMLDAFGPRGVQAPGVGDLIRGNRIDLRAWQEFYRGTNNLFAGPDGRHTNYFPVAPQPQTPAQDVLLALSRYQPTLEQLYAAAPRPYARFPNLASYPEGIPWLPQLATLKGCAQFLNLHAAAALANHDPATALQDIQLSFRLGAALGSDSLLISYLVRIAMSHIQLQAIWQGLADHDWMDAQLVALDAALAQEDHLKNYLIGLRGERWYGLQSIDQLQRTRDWNNFSDPAEPAANDSFWQATLGGSPLRLWPQGWFDQNKLSIAKLHANYTLPAVDVAQHLVSPTTQRQLEAAGRRNLRMGLYNLFGAQLLPAFQKSAEKVARIQAYTDLARVAIALERYRLAHGEFPETLAALEPQFIAKLPHDVINGQPLKYHRTADGLFVLYSVGWNETDDGGTVTLTKSGSVDPKQSDWVWRYPTP